MDHAGSPTPPDNANDASSSGDVIREDIPDRLTAAIDGKAQSPRLPFAVVGVGASAGGLEAYTEFLKPCAPDAGIAYVLIQHLSPKHTSIMAELLQQHTPMPVHQVENGMRVEPDHVYVIRPGYTMTLLDGRLHLGEAASQPMNRRPVDDFFKSLAEQQRERAIAVVLSGTGSNGTLGCQSIKTVGGLVIAQDPETAKFPSMPRSVIDANFADTILRPGEMFEAIRRYAGHAYARGGEEPPEALASRERQALTEVLTILRMRTRLDFSVYKKPTLIRRIQRRMSLTQIATMADYVRALRQTPGEVVALSDDLMIHVTGFFRDGGVWESLKRRVIVPMVHEKSDGAAIRCWVTACSSGEEAYTIGMLLLEAAAEADKRFDIKIFATDTAERSLIHARAGVFPGGIEGEITPERIDRFFDKEEAHYRVKKELRELVVFAPQNVLQDPPFSRLDLCTCRNLLIYIEAEAQRRILSLLHFGLREGGTLVLGNSETVTGVEDLFEPIDKPNRIYRRIGPTRHGLLEFPPPIALSARAQSQLAGASPEGDEPRALPRATIAQMAVKALLDEHTPAAVVIDRTGQIVYYHGATHDFLMHPTGEPTRDLMTLAREEVRGGVRTAVARAMQDGERVRLRDGAIGEGENRQRVEIGVAPLGRETPAQYLLVSFRRYADPPSLAKGSLENAQMADDLRRARDDLQSMIEELQTSNEELKASHEEVTSVNEELQSANEELETSKEELQSLNEELTTVNAQLQSKMEELERTTSDLSSLLSSTEIAVVFLDRTFRIRRYTPPARELFELIPGDAGRPLADLAYKFDDSRLLEDAQRVLEKLVPVEHELVAHNGRAYMRRVLPYRTVDNRIDGVVITFLDVTERTRAEASLRESEARFRVIAEVVPEMLWQADAAGLPVWHNARWTAYTGQNIQDARNGGWLGALHPEDREQTRAALDRAIRAGEPWRRDHRVRNAATGEYRWFLAQGVPERDAQGRVRSWFGSLTDIHDTRMTLADLSQRAGQLRSVLESARDFAIILTDPDGTITEWNAGAGAILGWGEAEALGRKGAMIFTPEDREARAPEREMEIALRDGRAPDERWHLRKEGTRFWGSGVQSVVRDEAGGVRGFVKILRDTTEQKVAEESLQAAKDAAEAASRAKDDFLATLSHELRTPLSAILIWAKLLRNVGDPAHIAEGLDAIRQSADAQKNLIDDLLDSARINSGKLRLDMLPTDLTAVVRSAVESVRPTAEAKGLEIAERYARDVGVVVADPHRLQQIVWNLLSNAVKFTSEGGRIEVALSRSSRHVQIAVADTGRGITAEFLPHIFERFRQEEQTTTRRAGGLGLGLAIVRELVQMHNGSVVATSAGPGKGATFTVTLPVPRRGRSPGITPPEAAEELPDAIRLDGLRVLLIEDDANTRTATRRLLEAAGATVAEAAASPEAVRSFQASRPDVIVSDLGLPGEDGVALLDRLRSLGGTATAVPAIAITAFAREANHGTAIAAGFSEVVTKPFTTNALLSAITRASRP